MRKFVVCATLASLMTACASYRPVVDMQGVSPSQYESDLRDCQDYARQRDPAAHAATGAVVGALIGVVFAAALGSSYSRNTGAALGAVSGGTSGLGHGADAQIGIVRNCMAGRGYRVLN